MYPNKHTKVKIMLELNYRLNYNQIKSKYIKLRTTVVFKL